MAESCGNKCPLIIACLDVVEADLLVMENESKILEINEELRDLKTLILDSLSRQKTLLDRSKADEEYIEALLEETDELEQILDLAESRTLASENVEEGKLGIDEGLELYSRIGAALESELDIRTPAINYQQLANVAMDGCNGPRNYRRWWLIGERSLTCGSPNKKQALEVLNYDSAA